MIETCKMVLILMCNCDTFKLLNRRTQALFGAVLHAISKQERIKEEIKLLCIFFWITAADNTLNAPPREIPIIFGAIQINTLLSPGSTVGSLRNN